MQRRIVVTGASSGLGAALAEAYAATGAALFLFGRNEARLAETAAKAAEAGAAQIETHTIDVSDAREMKEALDTIDAAAPLDLVIANAGVSGGTGGGGETADQTARIFDINLYGVLNTVQPVLPRMLARGRGQIAIMSSLAAYRGFAGAPAYSASKAAVKTYAEALRAAHAKDGVRINAICPGFVETPMTDVNVFAMPFLMPAPEAARRILRGLEKNKAVVAFPWPMHWAVSAFSLLPPALAVPLLSRMPEKG
ncbi:MAG: SDR family NAD(P)-dependent oxidoreductase [Alphaproteobacteria bacterium]|nr:SDR family NAD(P)-dependent oxidoreductase [Alphaproteobacteria bacterium]